MPKNGLPEDDSLESSQQADMPQGQDVIDPESVREALLELQQSLMATLEPWRPLDTLVFDEQTQSALYQIQVWAQEMRTIILSALEQVDSLPVPKYEEFRRLLSEVAHQNPFGPVGVLAELLRQNEQILSASTEAKVFLQMMIDYADRAISYMDSLQFFNFTTCSS